MTHTKDEALALALAKIKSARCCHPNAVQELIFEAEEILEQALAAPVHGEVTTYAERFTHAVAVLCGAQPPADMVAEWIANIDVNGEHRLQSWVLCQAATPSWAQGIVVLDAAHVLANDPEEGVGHEDRPPAAQPALPDALFRHAPEHPQYIEGWNDCRAEMLKGMKP